MSENMLMKKMMALDFTAIDIALFLDTHPNDKKALETYNAIVAEAKKVRLEYEKEFGPVCQSKGGEGGKWHWASEPWPWEKEANICLRGDE